MTIQELIKLTKHDTIKVYNDLSESEIFEIWETTGIPRHKIADEMLCTYSNRPDLKGLHLFYAQLRKLENNGLHCMECFI